MQEWAVEESESWIQENFSFRPQGGVRLSRGDMDFRTGVPQARPGQAA